MEPLDVVYYKGTFSHCKNNSCNVVIYKYSLIVLCWKLKIFTNHLPLAIHSITIAWKIPWTEKPGRLQSMGLQRVGHDWATSLHLPFLGHKEGSLILFNNTAWPTYMSTPQNLSSVHDCLPGKPNDVSISTGYPRSAGTECCSGMWVKVRRKWSGIWLPFHLHHSRHKLRMLLKSDSGFYSEVKGQPHWSVRQKIPRTS